MSIRSPAVWSAQRREPPVLTADGKLVGIVYAYSTSCDQAYVFPMATLYQLRPDLKPGERSELQVQQIPTLRKLFKSPG